ncbi:16S rRNA (guanine(527)-N(7))-methyltransferase RsmG [Paenilisteria rocourtiae]|uniref:Ribosomal RNA small subunit methyltransferase G n=1 Tax=Listeria rocourtiae TaxID=647910 RepID=A0A4R6ZH62_9LIST|nr:16S rRNA (guanine(527)-N(7))-methyltransferase RsmG [Listeria rocourtiae]EUJ47461.1 16S rRNA methyltransferase GidB [Listeria rocourtiae FSL F6-920]MBC1435433.1 16S rRNA (guanine(527)-N(7))-methyltransferase RsmG [Listeria rocourtiae]TDR51570.1 16S rRNA m(7)G-527 methyltransferase [Listeria rocourtiae]
MNPEQFREQLLQQGIELSDAQMEQFNQYFTMLVEWNEKMNLTAITERDEVYLKHFYDSISAAFYVDFKDVGMICDVGAGAGFPSIPIKICFPDLDVTIVDSLQKRMTFLDALASELKLENIHFHHARAEEFGQNKAFRGSFDLVTARAVARMSVLTELCLPLVKKGGFFLAMKGMQAEQELKIGAKAIATLGGKVKNHYAFSLPIEESERNLYLIEKVKETPNKYPRKSGTPNKQPIE